MYASTLWYAAEPNPTTHAHAHTRTIRTLLHARATTHMHVNAPGAYLHSHPCTPVSTPTCPTHHGRVCKQASFCRLDGTSFWVVNVLFGNDDLSSAVRRVVIIPDGALAAAEAISARACEAGAFNASGLPGRSQFSRRLVALLLHAGALVPH
jgi:hypothetical protein